MPTGVYKRNFFVMNCIKCNRKIKVGSGNGKYCEKCRLDIKRLASRTEKYKIRKAKNLKCNVCACDLTDFRGRSKYCPSCIDIKEKEWRKEHYERHKEQIKKYQIEYRKKPINQERNRKSSREYERRKRAEKNKLEEKLYV